MSQLVGLVIDENAMRRQLRHAFANHDTAVQELIQNARRAGASKVEITYKPEARELFVSDDGSGIEDFAVLMRAGASGWSSGVAAAEQPYGLGFLAAIYAAEHVSVMSRGKCLAFKSDDAVEHGQFEVIDMPSGSGTTVCLKGFDWHDFQASIAKMARGYPIRVVFNGQELNRSEAAGDEAQSTPVGQITLLSAVYPGAGQARIYLQGFLVKDARHYYGPHIIVHLDATRFLGKFPDRNVVIDEAIMVAAVDAEIRKLYQARLDSMRASLDPLAFCEKAHALAESLGQLSVFNDIEVAPRSWFQRFTEMPYRAFEWQSFLEDPQEGPAITREAVEAGDVQLCDLSNFDEENQRQWYFAWKAGMLRLDCRLDNGHWLIRGAAVHDGTDVDMRVIGETKREMIPSRTAEVYGDIVLCEAIELVANGSVVRITEPLGLGDPDAAIYLPMHDGQHVYPDEETLQQVVSFIGESDEVLEDELSSDHDIVCQKVREMLASSDEQRLALAIEAAIRRYQEVRGFSCTLTVSAAGDVEVTNLQQPDASRVAPG